MSRVLEDRRAAEAAREAEILDAAVGLLVDRGYDGLTYDALARLAHVGKATLYARWPGKADLVVDALRHEHERSPASAAAPDTGSLRSDLVALCEEFLHDRDRAGRMLLAVATAVQSDPAVAVAVHEHLGGAFRTRCRRILDAAVSRGELSPAVLRLPFALDLVPALSVTNLLLAPGHPLASDDVVDHVLLPVLTQNLTQNPTQNQTATDPETTR